MREMVIQNRNTRTEKKDGAVIINTHKVQDIIIRELK